jgi:Cell division protein FtsL.
MIKSGQYVQGSTAEKISYDVYEENKVLKSKKKQKSYAMMKFKAVCCLLAVFAMGSLVMYRYATITKLNYSLTKQTKVYNDILKENSILSVEIEQATDLQKVRSVAENTLGMQKPDKRQINYVSISKGNYTKVSSVYANEKYTNSLPGWIQNILGLIK